MRLVAALLSTLLILTLPAGAWGNGKSRKGQVEIEGVIIATLPHERTVIVRDERGRTWSVLIDLVTEIEFEEDDDDDRLLPATIHALRAGDEVEVKGLLLSDGRLLALKIEVEGERRGVHLPPPGIIIIRGVVIVVASTTLVVITDDGTVTVVIQSGTRFFEDNRRITRGALGRHDVVLVRGHRSRERFVADQVNVEFDATEGVTLTGVVGSLWVQGGAFFFVGSPTWVNVTSRTFIIRNRSQAALTAIRPGGSVVVYGRGRGTAMQAMVIVVH